MDPTRMLAESRGFFHRREALAEGLCDKDLSESIRLGVLIRIRRGYYTYTDLWVTLGDRARHLVLCRAILHCLDPGFVLSHTSAALLHGIDLYDADLSDVHVTRLGRVSSRHEAGVVVHTGRVPDTDVVEVHGLLAVCAERAVLEAGTLSTAESSFVAFNSYLNQGLGGHEPLFARFEQMGRWPGTRHLHIPIRMATDKPETVGESRCLWVFSRGHVPLPVCQYPVYDRDGALIATTDFGWPEEHTLGEFDGKVKYGRLLKPGHDSGDVVFAEKQREDRVREITDSRMVRFVWNDLQRPRLMVSRVFEQFRRAAG